MKTQTLGMRMMLMAGAVIGCLALSLPAFGQGTRKKDLLRETDEAFFCTEDARRIGEQVLIYQRCTGAGPRISTWHAG